MKTIALIGASGFVGSAILKEALYRDLQVTAIVRRPESIALRSLNLETRTADAADPTALREAVRNHDAVISAYNPGWNNPDIYEQTLSVYPRIVEAVKLAGIKRLLVVGGAGSLYVGPGMRLLDEAKLSYPLKVRRWSEGDAFVPFGMGGRRKKVSDMLIDDKVSLPDKRRQFVVVSGGDIVWLVGRRIDERYAVGSGTENVLRIRILPDDDL